MAISVEFNHRRPFWQVKFINGKNVSARNSMDSVKRNEHISNIFAFTDKHLYTSVCHDPNVIDKGKSRL